MKKAIIAVLAFAVLATGVLFAFGQRPADGEKGWGRHGGGHRRGFGIVLRGLNLTEDQKTKVKAIHEASKASVQPTFEAMKANREKMEALTANGAFDEAQVTALANEQAAISAKLIVEKERVKSQIFAILTDEQKTKLAEMKAKRAERMKARKEAKAEKISE